MSVDGSTRTGRHTPIPSHKPWVLFEDIQKLLESQKLTLGDVVSMHVYLGSNPANDGKPDFSGLMAGYTQFFGTKDQPNKPSRTVVQVVLPAASSGALIEVDLIAVRPT